MNRRVDAPLAFALVLCVAGFLAGGCGAGDADAPAVAVRWENLTVTPATGPVTHVLVKNLRRSTYRGTIRVVCPASWKLNRTSASVTIRPHQTVRVPFAIERGTNAESNSYPVQIEAIGGGAPVRRTQAIVCASAPYFKPQIDGNIDDWGGAIPVTFAVGGKKSVIRTYWSRQNLSLMVAVEETALHPPGSQGAGAGADAVQIAISPRNAETPSHHGGSATSAGAKAQRYEFLLAAAGKQPGGKCFALIQPGQKLSLAPKSRPLAGLELAGAQVAVVRKDGVTYYECSIPLKAMPLIRADPGREFCLSVLVHDGDGTGLRDWGEAAGLWPQQRNRLARCLWQGAKWPKDPPFDNKIEWGFCSSKD